MNIPSFVIDMYRQNLSMIEQALEDFSDDDFFARTCPGANTTAWQVGHMTAAEANMVNSYGIGPKTELPEGFAAKFNKETSKSDDRSAFPSRKELLATMRSVRESSIKFVQALKEEDLSTPTTEKMRSFIPTLGHTVFLLPTHWAMHLGQFQVARRKLGKANVM